MKPDSKDEQNKQLEIVLKDLESWLFFKILVCIHRYTFKLH